MNDNDVSFRIGKRFDSIGYSDIYHHSRLRVLGNLPDVVIGISDVHLIMLLKLLISIPKPPADPVTEKVLSGYGII